MSDIIYNIGHLNKLNYNAVQPKQIYKQIT